LMFCVSAHAGQDDQTIHTALSVHAAIPHFPFLREVVTWQTWSELGQPAPLSCSG
jgi:hypothetical protein